MDFYARPGMHGSRPSQTNGHNTNVSPTNMTLTSIEPKMLFDLVFLSVMSIALCCSSAYVCFKLLAAQQAGPWQRGMCLLMSTLDLVGGATVLFAANLHFSDRQSSTTHPARCGLWLAINLIFLTSSTLSMTHVAASWQAMRAGGQVYGSWMADRKAQTLMSWTVLASTFYLYSDIKASEPGYRPIC